MPLFETPDGVKIHYVLAGNGKPLLFLHGWAMCHRVWKYQEDRFRSDYQVICPDLPGHGASECPPGPCDFASLARDIARFIEGLRLQSITLIGWSMGASLAILLAASRRLPVDSLVLVDGTPSFLMREDFPYGLPAVSVRRMIKLAERDFSRALEEFHSFLFSEEERTLSAADEIRDLVTNRQYLPQPEAARSLLASLAREDLRENLVAIGIPCLLLHGDQDTICPPGASAYMHNRLERAETVTFFGAGHAPFLTRADEFNRALATFLTQYDRQEQNKAFI